MINTKPLSFLSKYHLNMTNYHTISVLYVALLLQVYVDQTIVIVKIFSFPFLYVRTSL